MSWTPTPRHALSLNNRNYIRYNEHVAIRTQPAGIRVTDAIAWAHEILARYSGYLDTSNNAHGLP